MGKVTGMGMVTGIGKPIGMLGLSNAINLNFTVGSCEHPQNKYKVVVFSYIIGRHAVAIRGQLDFYFITNMQLIHLH